MNPFRIALVALLLVAASAALADWTSIASYRVNNNANQSILRHEWTSSATDSTGYDISGCTAGVEGRFDPSVLDSSTDATFEFRMTRNSTDTAGRGREIEWPGPSDGSTWVAINALVQGENYIIAHPTSATTGGDTARVEIRCTSNETLRPDTGGVLVQAIPEVAEDSDATTATITTPAVTKFGFGVTTATPNIFTAKTYNGGSTTGNEADHTFGIFYNKAGVGSSTIPNRFEHSIDRSFETSYRSTGATSDETWMEENLDITPPDFSTTVTGITGTFVAGDNIEFSGGGTAVVVSWSSPTLVFRQDYGTTAAGETITNRDRSGGGTLGTLTANGTQWRSFLWVYKTLQNTTSWEFYNQPNQTYPVLGISANFVKTNGNVVVSGTNSAIYGPTMWVISNGGSFDTGDEVCPQLGFTCQDVLEFSTPATPTDSTCATTNANGVKFLAMCK